MRKPSEGLRLHQNLDRRIAYGEGNAKDLVLLRPTQRSLSSSPAASATPRTIGKPEREAFADGYRGTHETDQGVFRKDFWGTINEEDAGPQRTSLVIHF
jgi:hypothetical protein